MRFVSGHLTKQGMLSEAMRINPAAFFLMPHQFKTYGMSIKALEVDPWQLHDVPDHFKTQEMCDRAVRDDLFSLQFVHRLVRDTTASKIMA